MEHLHIQTFGNFILQAGNAKISDSDNRSKKVWLLLAYILCKRGRQVTRKELISLLWGDESSNNPENALKTTFHRVRTLLDQLWPSAGHQLINWKDGGAIRKQPISAAKPYMWSLTMNRFTAFLCRRFWISVI